jgi:hypothetical protein
MTYFLDFRTRDIGGAAVYPNLLEGDGTAGPGGLQLITPPSIPRVVAGRNLLFVAHGFNVSRPYGAFSIGSLDVYLGLTAPDLIIGVLWPGDWWLPVVNYPFEGEVAIACGKFLAQFCNTSCVGAQSLSFLSHSLGARLILEAILHLDRADVRSVCLTAAAINRDCLTREYRFVRRVTERIAVLASEKDHVLRLAYSVGDPFADLLHDDHTPFQPALGYKGPPVPAIPPIAQPWQIPNAPAYGHGDYFPKDPLPAEAEALWHLPADFMKRAFQGQRQTWPPS